MMASLLYPSPMQQQPQQFSPSLKLVREEYENPRGWAEIQAQSMHYLMETHPKSQCQCNSSAEPCQGMKLVMWAQAMVQLAQQQRQQHGSQSASIFDAKVSDLVKFIPTNLPGDNKNLFSDLYLAVSMFGSNIFFLPRFYQHIQHVATSKPPFVPRLLRPTTGTEHPGDVENSGLDIEEEEEGVNEPGNNNDVF